MHQNPVEAGLIFRAEDYRYSSAIDYSDEKELLDNVVVLECLTFKERPHERIRVVAGGFSDITGLDRLEFLLREDEIAILYGARRYHSSGLVEGHYLVAVKVEKKVYLLEGQTGEILLYDKTSIESKNFERDYRQLSIQKQVKLKNRTVC